LSSDFLAALLAAFLSVRREIIFIMSGFATTRCGSNSPRYVCFRGHILSNRWEALRGISEGFGASLGVPVPGKVFEDAGDTAGGRGDISAVDVVHQLLHQAAGHRPLALRAGSQTRLLIALGVQGVSPQLACGLGHLLRLQLVTRSPASLDHRGTHLL